MTLFLRQVSTGQRRVIQRTELIMNTACAHPGCSYKPDAQSTRPDACTENRTSHVSVWSLTPPVRAQYQYKTVRTVLAMGIPIVNIRQSCDYIMGIPIQVDTIFILKRTPVSQASFCLTHPRCKKSIITKGKDHLSVWTSFAFQWMVQFDVLTGGPQRRLVSYP